MAQLSLPCPHCLTEKAAFTPLSAAPMGPKSARQLTFFQCAVCKKGLMVEFGGNTVGLWIGGHAPDPGPVLDCYPLGRVNVAPADVADNVKDAYLSGMHNLDKKFVNAAVAMFRRAVEISVRVLDPTAPARTALADRLRRLPPDLITPAMIEWAHLVRLGGNDALHDPEDFSEAEAAELKAFTELFLTYAFTLPAMLSKAKGPPTP
jgi:hypothetical protein